MSLRTIVTVAIVLSSLTGCAGAVDAPAEEGTGTTAAAAGHCVQTVLCIRGYQWDSRACKCVPQPGYCATNADCHLVACGTTCDSLNATDPAPKHCGTSGINPCVNACATCDTTTNTCGVTRGACTAP